MLELLQDAEVLSCSFHLALDGIFGCLAEADRYITREAPWALLKNSSDKTRAGTVLYVLCDCLRMAAIDLQCFMPASMSQLLTMLGVSETARDFSSRATRLEEGGRLVDVQAIFPRLEREDK